MQKASNNLLSGLSPRAEQYLASVGIEKMDDQMSEEEMRRVYGPLVSEDLLQALMAFEVRYGGLVIDAGNINIELGVGRLAKRDIEVEVNTEKNLVLVGTEENADLWLDDSSWLWVSYVDRVPGELAVSLERYIERLAVSEIKPSEEPFTLFIYGSPSEVVRILELEVDSTVTDETFVFARSDQYVFRAHLRGTEWNTSHHALQCRDYDALVHALKALAAEIPTLRCTIAIHPSLQQTDANRTKDTAKPADIEKRFAAQSILRIPAADGGATHLLQDGTIGTYSLDEEGDEIATETHFSAKGGTHIHYLIPWPER